MPDESKELCARASSGDPVAVDELVALHYSRIQTYLRLKTGINNPHESLSDLVQSTCRELLAGCQDFDWQGEAAFIKWLYKGADNKLCDKLRRMKAAKRDPQRVEVGDPDFIGPENAELLSRFRSPEANAMHREEAHEISTAIMSLPDDYRRVLIDHKILNQSHAQIAEDMDRSEAAVRKLLHRAIAHLQSSLRKTDDDVAAAK